MIVSAEEIAKAKVVMRNRYVGGTPSNQSDDCVRIAYEWLDAQVRTRKTRYLASPLKHYIEAWAGRYVSQPDVELAAYLHPAIRGRYPFFNISLRLTEPHQRRLEGIEEAGKHPNYREHGYRKIYSRVEP